MKSKILLMLTVVGSLWMVGCSNDEPAVEKVSLKMKAETSLSTINSSGRAKATGLSFKEVLVGVRKLDFETSGEDEHEDEDGDTLDIEYKDSLDVEFNGPFTVDLIKGTSTPDFGLASIHPGVYNEIEIKMGPVLEDGNTIFIAFGYKPDGSDSVQVEFSTKAELEFEIESENGYQLDGNVLTNILVLLNLDALFHGVDLSGASVDADGVIRISDTSNADITHKIISNFDDSYEAGEDQDDDDDIDED